MTAAFAPMLGLRLLRGQGRTGIARIALMVLGTALGVVLLLVALSVEPVIHARDARLAARTPVCDHGNECGLGAEVTGSFYRAAYTEVLVSAPAGTPAPAGLPRLPKPGETFLSPALEALATKPDNQLLRQRLGGRVIGTIGNAGLLQPDELLAYVGVARLDNTQHQGRIVGYGGKAGGTSSAQANAGLANAQSDRNVSGRLDPQKVTVDLTSIVLLLPVLLFLATCARLSARTRDRRLASLRLVGMTPWQTRVVNAVETGVAAIAGSLVGLGVFELLRAPLSTITLDGRGWFAGDATPGTGHIVGLLLAIPLLAVATGTIAVRSVAGPLLTSRTEATSRRLRYWRLAPLVAGAVLLSIAGTGKGQGSAAIGLMGGGLILTIAGLSIAVPLLAQLVATGLARVTGSLPVLLGARRIQTEAAGISRVVTGLVLLVFAGGFAQGALAAVKADVVADSVKWQPHLRSTVMVVPGLDDASHLAPSVWSTIPGVTGVLGLRQLVGPPVDEGAGAIAAEGPSAVVATCADLSALLAQPPVGCREGVAYELPPDPDLPAPAPDPTGTVKLVDQSAMQDTDPATGKLRHAPVVATIPRPTQTLQVQGVQSFSNTFSANIVLPPGTPELAGLATTGSQQYFLLTDGSPRTIEAVRTAAARIDPRLWVSTAAEFNSASSDVEGYHFPLYTVLIGWGTALALLVAFASVAVATVDRAVERRRHVAMQTAIGVPATTVRRAQLVQVLVPYGVGILCATGFSVLATLAYAHLTRPEAAAQLPARQLVVTMVVALGGALVVALSVLPALGRPLTPEVLRRE